MLLHVLGHVEADDGVLVVEEEFSQSLGELGLSHAGRPQEHEGSDRTVLFLESGTGASHRIGDGLDGLLLTDDTLDESILHPDQLLPLTLLQA